MVFGQLEVAPSGEPCALCGRIAGVLLMHPDPREEKTGDRLVLHPDCYRKIIEGGGCETFILDEDEGRKILVTHDEMKAEAEICDLFKEADKIRSSLRAKVGQAWNVFYRLRAVKAGDAIGDAESWRAQRSARYGSGIHSLSKI